MVLLLNSLTTTGCGAGGTRCASSMAVEEFRQCTKFKALVLFFGLCYLYIAKSQLRGQETCRKRGLHTTTSLYAEHGRYCYSACIERIVNKLPRSQSRDRHLGPCVLYLDLKSLFCCSAAFLSYPIREVCATRTAYQGEQLLARSVLVLPACFQDLSEYHGSISGSRFSASGWGSLMVCFASCFQTRI